MPMEYFRPIVMCDAARPADALSLAGGSCWFDRIEVLSRNASPKLIAAKDAPREFRNLLSQPRADFAGVSLDRPRLMGVLNVTPDSFSDAGQNLAPKAALMSSRL